MNIPIAHSTESLERFLEHIVVDPVPDKVTPEYLRKSGFISGNDVELRHIFRLLGFLNEEGVPLERWREYKEQGQEILRLAVQESYKGLFTLYSENAYKLSEDELRNWFKPPITSSSKSSIERAIRTFRRLSQLAGMVSKDQKIEPAASSPVEGSLADTQQALPPSLQPVFQIPVLATKEQYVEVFEAIKKVFYA